MHCYKMNHCKGGFASGLQNWVENDSVYIPRDKLCDERVIQQDPLYGIKSCLE